MTSMLGTLCDGELGIQLRKQVNSAARGIPAVAARLQGEDRRDPRQRLGPPCRQRQKPRGKVRRPSGRGAPAAVRARTELDRDPVADDAQGDHQHMFVSTSALERAVRKALPSSDALTVQIVSIQGTRTLRRPAGAPLGQATWSRALRTASDPARARIRAAARKARRPRSPASSDFFHCA